jgi:hypothetical protein
MKPSLSQPETHNAAEEKHSAGALPVGTAVGGDARVGLGLSLGHNECHEAAQDALRESAIWSALSGFALLAEKLTLPHGAWLPWVEANCRFCHRTATNHMRHAEKVAKVLGVNLDALDGDGYDFLREQVARYLQPGAIEQRTALLAALNPPPPELPPAPPAPEKPPRAPRPAGPRPLTMDAVPPLVPRLRLAAPEVRASIYREFRDEIISWVHREEVAP